ncbi:MAG: hypothetical protein GX670_03975 [Bacteroidales bacterium]|nr:hypothetical protein [Bacteroidales bacterium]
MKALREDGFTLRGIADLLNTRNVITKQGKTWHASTVSYILNNAA